MPLGRIELRKGLVGLIILLMAAFGFFLMGQLDSSPVESRWKEEGVSWLSECKHIYIDCGTNVGVQIRKLFEPHLYPKALMRPHFNQHFGLHRAEDVCAIGFEPNPRFENKLKELESVYNTCGFKTKIFTRTAASAFNVKKGAHFWSDGNENANELGGSIVQANRGGNLDRGNVDLVRLADFILQEVNVKERGGSVLMKIDIEGSELEVLTDLLLSGALSRINIAFVEWHIQTKNKSGRGVDLDKVKSLIENTNTISQKYNLSNSLHVVNMDDETYFNEEMPLPKCFEG